MLLIPALIAFAPLAFAAIPAPAGPEITSHAELREALRSAKPGDTITLAATTFEGTLTVTDLHGEKDKPIVIRGASSERRPTFRNRAGQPGGEGIHLSHVSYITLENIGIQGTDSNGLNIDDGGRLDSPSVGVTVRNIFIDGIVATGNIDAIKLSGLKDFTIERCNINRWGNGGSAIDMVGCRDGTIRDCEINGLGSEASGIQAKGGSRDIAIQKCFLKNAGYRAFNIGGSTGLQFFRPKPEGFEAARITVEGCIINGSDTAAAFVGVDGATFRFNTTFGFKRWAIRILQENRAEGFVPSRKGDVTDNIFYFDDLNERNPPQAANIGDATDAASFSFARNFWFWDHGKVRMNLPSAEKDGRVDVNPELFDTLKGGQYWSSSGAAKDAGAHAWKPTTTKPAADAPKKNAR